MVTDKQVRRLMNLIRRGKGQAAAAAGAGMDEKTARKYLRSGKLPSESRRASTAEEAGALGSKPSEVAVITPFAQAVAPPVI